MTETKLFINGELVFKAPEVLKDGEWIEALLGIEDQARKKQAYEDELQRKRDQESRERAAYLARADELGEAACFIAKNLGKETKQRWHSDYHYERHGFIIETNREDNPKLFYNGICVLHMIYQEGDELQRSWNECHIYHADPIWEKQLLDLADKSKRKVEKNRKEQQLLHEQEYRKNHLPLKDL